MTAKKIITSFILICMSIFAFFGCAELDFYRAVDGTGKIIDKIVVTLDKQEIEKSKLSYTQIANQVEYDMQNFVGLVENWKKTEFSDSKLANVSLRVSEGLSVAYDHIEGTSKYSVTLEFADWSIFGLFYGFTTISLDEGKYDYSSVMNDYGPFINKIIEEDFTQDSMNIFLYKYSKLDSSSLLKDIKNIEIGSLGNYYNKYSELTKKDLNALQINQSFVYPDDRLYSNADETEITGGLTFLNWNLSEKDEDFEMSIYKIAPKTISWYILALILSLVAVGVIALVIIFKGKDKSREEITKREVEKSGKQ